MTSQTRTFRTNEPENGASSSERSPADGEQMRNEPMVFDELAPKRRPVSHSLCMALTRQMTRTEVVEDK